MKGGPVGMDQRGFKGIPILGHFSAYRFDKEAPGWLHIPVL